MGTSPYAAALGTRRDDLDARLRAYFDTIPAGHHGFGTGVFDVVGTPRRWLHPLLRLLRRRGVVPAGFWRDVPFTVVNRTVGDTAIGMRTFHFPAGDWTMTDRVTRTTGGITDVLGSPATVAVAFTLHPSGDGLTLHSTRAGLRIGRLRLTAPSWFTPTVRVTEAGGDRQRVTMTMDLPLVGRVYEYAGSFDYVVRADA